MAFQYEEASKLQPLSFLTPVYQLVADLLLFASVFNASQLIGMAIVCGVFLVELIYNCFKKTICLAKETATNDDDTFKKQI
jgi:drug/metabolite transporter (DMT)-like permease